MSYPHMYTSYNLGNIATEIDDERAAQDAKFGPQNHPDGTTRVRARIASAARGRCDLAAENGDLTWRHILDEEVQEAFAEEDPAELRAELIQIAAVAVAWIQALDRRRALGAITQADWAANADPTTPAGEWPNLDDTPTSEWTVDPAHLAGHGVPELRYELRRQADPTLPPFGSRVDPA